MVVKWHSANERRQIEQRAFRGVRKGTLMIQREAVRLIIEEPKTGRTYGSHQASAPGESPASDTGRLVQSINSTFDPAAIMGTVSASALHAAFLEFGTNTMGARPFMRPALENKRAEVIAVIKKEVETGT